MRSSIFILLLLIFLFSTTHASRNTLFLSKLKKALRKAGRAIKGGIKDKIGKGIKNTVVKGAKVAVSGIKKANIGNQLKNHIAGNAIEFGKTFANHYKNTVVGLGNKDTWLNYAKNPFKGVMAAESLINPGMVALNTATGMMAQKIPIAGDMLNQMNPWTSVNRLGNKYGTFEGWKENVKQWKNNPLASASGLAEDLSDASSFIPLPGGAGAIVGLGKTAAMTAVKTGVKVGLKTAVKSGIKAGVKHTSKLSLKKIRKVTTKELKKQSKELGGDLADSYLQ
jgi:hypothetical protein